jgi:hypothetical protein
MMGQHRTSQPAVYHPGYTDIAHRLARLGATEEAIAHLLEVPVYTVNEWAETIPEFAEAVEQGWVIPASQTLRSPSRNRFPAYTFALRFAARTVRPDLAAVLRASMAEMKALGPNAMAAFNDALEADVTALQPGRRIPRRAG